MFGGLGRVGLGPVKGGNLPPPSTTSVLLLTDGSSKLLLVDGVSFLKLASSS